MPSSRRAYEELRSGIEDLGGTMNYSRSGHPGGVWEVTLGNRSARFLSSGAGFPELDELYVLRDGVVTPTHYDDYSQTLVPGAIGKLVNMLR